MITINFPKSKSPQRMFVLQHIIAVDLSDARIDTLRADIKVKPFLILELTNGNVVHLEYESKTERDRSYRNVIAAIHKINKNV